MKGSDFCDRAALGECVRSMDKNNTAFSPPPLPSVISASSFTSNLIPRYEYHTPLRTLSLKKLLGAAFVFVTHMNGIN